MRTIASTSRESIEGSSGRQDATPASLCKTDPRLARFAWFVVSYNVAVILWGALVRATGSGAGCGSHWPLCNGEILPTSAKIQTLIEFTHRVTSGLSLVLMAILLVWCWRRTAKGAWARYSCVVAAILLFNEALLGAMLVLFEYVGLDQSASRVVFLCLHFGNTLLLVAALVLTAQWLSKGERRFVVTPKRHERIVILFGLVCVMVTGMTGTLAALGDTIFPAASLRGGLTQDFSSNSHVLLRLRFLHPVVAAVAFSYVLWMAQKLSKDRDESSRLLPLLTMTILAQVGLGVLNVLLLAPIWLQITHLFVAEMFWIMMVLASSEVLIKNPASL
jgi:cytochrome c oxidase assembly protein subunit 15